MTSGTDTAGHQGPEGTAGAARGEVRAPRGGAARTVPAGLLFLVFVILSYLGPYLWLERVREQANRTRVQAVMQRLEAELRTGLSLVGTDTVFSVRHGGAGNIAVLSRENIEAYLSGLLSVHPSLEAVSFTPGPDGNVMATRNGRPAPPGFVIIALRPMSEQAPAAHLRILPDSRPDEPGSLVLSMPVHDGSAVLGRLDYLVTLSPLAAAIGDLALDTGASLFLSGQDLAGGSSIDIRRGTPVTIPEAVLQAARDSGEGALVTRDRYLLVREMADPVSPYWIYGASLPVVPPVRESAPFWVALSLASLLAAAMIVWLVRLRQASERDITFLEAAADGRRATTGLSPRVAQLAERVHTLAVTCPVLETLLPPQARADVLGSATGNTPLPSPFEDELVAVVLSLHITDINRYTVSSGLQDSASFFSHFIRHAQEAIEKAGGIVTSVSGETLTSVFLPPPGSDMDGKKVETVYRIALHIRELVDMMEKFMSIPRVDVSIHAGYVFVGFFEGKKRRFYGAMGEGIATSDRILAIGRRFATRDRVGLLLLSEAAAACLPGGRVPRRSLGRWPIGLHGQEENVYRVELPEERNGDPPDAGSGTAT